MCFLWGITIMARYFFHGACHPASARNPEDKLVGGHIVELQVLLLDTLAVDAEDILALLPLLEILDLEGRGQLIASHEHRSRGCT